MTIYSNPSKIYTVELLETFFIGLYVDLFSSSSRSSYCGLKYKSLHLFIAKISCDLYVHWSIILISCSLYAYSAFFSDKDP